MLSQAPLINITQCELPLSQWYKSNIIFLQMKEVKSVGKNYEISELAECGILPRVNLNLIFWFLPSHSKLFVLVMATNL